MNNSNKKYNLNTAKFLVAFPYTGLLGIHDLYLGNMTKGIIKLVTCNFFFIGWIYDIYQIFKGVYKLNDGSSIIENHPKEPERSNVLKTPQTVNTGSDNDGENFNLIKEFDNAIAEKDEGDAIIYGSDLLNEGEILHVFLGFKKLALLGFEQSKELYVVLLLRFIKSFRNNNCNEISENTCALNVNELKQALPIAETIDDSLTEKLSYINSLRGELLYWHWMASKHFENNENNGHLIAFNKLFDELKNEEWAKEYITFCS